MNVQRTICIAMAASVAFAVACGGKKTPLKPDAAPVATKAPAMADTAGEAPAADTVAAKDTTPAPPPRDTTPASPPKDTAAAAVPKGTAAAAPSPLAGFKTPESVLHDEVADVYLVSNIVGGPADRDGDGQISRVSPDGKMIAAAWIDGKAEGVQLSAPKGMAIVGDVLYVTDIDHVRRFDRKTGARLGSTKVEGASFLNDVAAESGGSVLVSDTGVDASFKPTGTAAVYRITEDGKVTKVVSDKALGLPNGLAASGDMWFVVTFGAEKTIQGYSYGGERGPALAVPAGQLDGLVALDDGSFLVSSWETGSVYRIADGKPPVVVVKDVESPADIGWDNKRQRLLIPLFMGNKVVFKSL